MPQNGLKLYHVELQIPITPRGYFLRLSFHTFRVPRMAISDGDPHFIDRKFWRFLYDHGVCHNIVTPYHPQTSRQAETSKKQSRTFCRKLSMRWEQHGKISYTKHYGLIEHITKHLLECHHTNLSMSRHVTYLLS
jgi:hypothetical protein